MDHLDDIHKFGDGFALLVLELTRKICRKDPNQKSRFVRCLFSLLKSESIAVSYESAWSLVSLSSAPTAVRAAAQTYALLLNTSSDNNIKLIVLDRLIELKVHHSKVVREVLMDILRALSSPNIDISKKTLSLAIDMVGPRNIDEVIQVLKREIVRAQETELENSDEYKLLLINAIHKCATRFSEVADSVVLVLLDFISGEGGYNVLTCVKSIVEQYPNYRSVIISKVINNFDEITNADALRVGLWLLGEYSDVTDPNTNESMSLQAYTTIQSQLGEPPFIQIKDNESTDKSDSKTTTTPTNNTTTITKNVVLSDGTYGSVTKTSEAISYNVDNKISSLRKSICSGNVLLVTVASVTLTKIVLKLSTHLKDYNLIKLNVLLIITALGKFVETKGKNRAGAYADSLDRINLCIRILLDPVVNKSLAGLLLESGKSAYHQLVNEQKNFKAKTLISDNAKKGTNTSQPDDLIQFRQLRSQAVQGGIEVDLMDADDISRAVGSDNQSNANNKLIHVHQLTGYNDPVYAEAVLTVHDYDIIIDLLIINRTPNTLTNLTIELATMGDLKIVERPQSYTIGPLDERKLRANIKVSSTETGHVFGTIVFDNASTAQKTYVTLNDIQLDIMDYIRAADCKNEDFRAMWEEFEWENKVAINTNILDLKEFLSHIIAHTNMTCLTPIEDSFTNLAGSNFLAANLYARSVFGEDALVNVSVERKDDLDGKLSGYIRIRSKTQGIALSLGDDSLLFKD
eukprot:CAMPEP_0196763628 /NCGR_PEP_ID=MMETSP1095-20130614/4448_1 /TAXON_ID=96789 ORGANISM="Chromulina nebulosa, Strain UTEXLB2642" /NCGR_SAMPLE_ID=MMETSP1095 /ASSEMBLY_ACC=CAM_ASM_000446 /LENGTH=744 /DNA_ID=CAMNT_0042117237 /DNA_START=637 /DNA_END=2872 /DNA_ORIENTATION=+